MARVRIEAHELESGSELVFTIAGCADGCEQGMVFVREGALRLPGENEPIHERQAVLTFTTLTLHNDEAAIAKIITIVTQPASETVRCGTGTLPRALRSSLREPLVLSDGSLSVRILFDDQAMSAALSVLDGDGDLRVPEHRHPESVEALYIESGSGMMHIEGQELAVRPGMIVTIPQNALHDFQGDGTIPLRAIQVYAPPGPEQRFRVLAREGGP